MNKNDLKKIVKEELKKKLVESNKNRYVATIDFYVYADNDKMAKQEVLQIMKMIDEKYDNRPSMIDLKRQDFGKFGSIPVKTEDVEDSANNWEGMVKEDIATISSYGVLVLAILLALFPRIKNFMKNISDYGIKDLYIMWKKDFTIGPILDRLSKDPEVVNHLKTKGIKGIRNIINSKLMDNEKQYINKIYGQDIQNIINKAEQEKSL